MPCRRTLYRNARIDRGQCVTCPRMLIAGERVYCLTCRIRMVDQGREQRRRERIAERELGDDPVDAAEASAMQDADTIIITVAGALPCVSCKAPVKAGPRQWTRAMRLRCPWAVCRRCADTVRKIKGEDE